MDLKGLCTLAMVDAVGTTIKAAAASTGTAATDSPKIIFYEGSTALVTLTIPAESTDNITAIFPTRVFNDTTGCTADFTTIASTTAAVSGSVDGFSVFQTLTGATVLTGTVATTGGDINFNTTSWDVGDNISITALSFFMPK